jgi:hypothetical protein
MVTMIKIHNFRAGFATNSSSSHSVVLIPDYAVGNVSPIHPDSGEYGWGYFRLVTQEQKLRYLAAQCAAGGWSSYNNEIRSAILAEVPTTKFDEQDYVDHQSVMSMGAFRPDVLKGMIKLFMSPKVVVLGGNDNSDSDENHVEGQEPEPLSTALTHSFESKVRFDDGIAVIMNKHTGNKSRISLDDRTYDKAKYPELVDIKITNWCDAGCQFCYQSSTENGHHGDTEVILDVLDILSKMEVFEVAIGGGEPTAHPDFADILDACKKRDIVPNFTTLSRKWLDNEPVVAAVKKHVGGIGVSCLSAKGLALVDDIKAAVSGRWDDGPKVMAQHVLGSVPLWVTAEFLNAAFEANHPVLLLGYKDVGFGKDYERHDGGDVPLFLKTGVQRFDGKASLSVDTALVDRYPELVQALGAVQAQVSSPEGKFSCYVDAVDRLIGPSSYVPPTAMEPLPASFDGFAKTFASY